MPDVHRVVLVCEPVAGEAAECFGCGETIGCDAPHLVCLVSTFTLSRTPKFKLSTTGLLRSCLLDDTSLRPLERADEVGDLTGEVVGRRPAEVRRDHNLAPAAPHPDEPDSPRWAAAVLVEAVVDLDAERA